MTRKELKNIMFNACTDYYDNTTQIYKITLDNMAKHLKEAGVEIEEDKTYKTCKTCQNCKFNPVCYVEYDHCSDIIGACYNREKWKPRSK